MKGHKGFKYRLYPIVEQRTMFAKAAGCSRLVSNLALEQRRSFGREGRRLNYNSAANELPELKAAFEFIKEVPSQVLQQSLRDLETAFKNFFAGTAGYPKPKRKFENDSFRIPQGFSLERGFLVLPKIGRVKMTMHRPFKGRLLYVTIVREGDHWYASLTAEVNVAPPTVRPLAEVGVDLNIITGAVTSDGDIYSMPRTSLDERRKQARLQKAIARKKKGSKNRHKAKRALARFSARIKRRRKNTAHVISRRLTNAYTHVAFENLKIKNMTASAAGTIEAPGRNVAQKSGLNRALLDVAPGMIRSMTKYKLGWAGGVCQEVVAAGTSQRCSSCRRHPKDTDATKHLAHGRITRDDFVCPLCGFAEHADINAARNILALGRRQWSAIRQPGGPPGPACGGLRSRRAYETGKRSQGEGSVAIAAAV